MSQTITPSDIHHQTSDCYKVTVYSHVLKNCTYSSKGVYFSQVNVLRFDRNSTGQNLKLEDMESKGNDGCTQGRKEEMEGLRGQGRRRETTSL